MNATKDIAFRFGFAVTGAIIGYLIADTAGLGAGIFVGLFIPVFWHAYQDGLTVQKDGDNSASDGGKWHERPFGTRLALFTLSGYGALFLLYAVIIAGRHDSRAMLEWLRQFQPAVDWYATFIPAFDRVANNLTARGRADWIPAMQHLLLVTWFFLPVFVVWFTLDFLLINRRYWSQPQLRFLAKTTINVVGRIKVGIGCALGTALLLWAFVFGFGIGGGRRFSAIDAPMTALVGLLFILLIIAGLRWAMIVMQSRPSDADIEVDKELARRIAFIESLFRRWKKQ